MKFYYNKTLTEHNNTINRLKRETNNGSMINKIPELLCPAGDLRRLCAAVDYGADAVYLAGEEFGMRTAAANFGEEDLKKGIEYAHKHGVKVHIACNIIPHNEEIARLPDFFGKP